MAAFERTRPTTYGTATLASRTVAYITDLALDLQAWNDARITRNSLKALSNRELADIGLTRGEIDSVARSTFTR